VDHAECNEQKKAMANVTESIHAMEERQFNNALIELDQMVNQK
jgi:hypothetical protein